MNDKESLIYSLKIDPDKKAKVRQGWSRKKKILLGIAIFLAAAIAWISYDLSQAPEVKVARAEVVQEGLPEIILTAGGYIEADSTILVSSQINGKIKTMLVEEGDLVKKGQVLAEIEDDDYRSKKDLAEAELNFAKATLNRKANLFREGVISKAEYDEAVRAYKVAEATFESSKYFLENTKIRSPIDGTVIKKEKEPGEFLLPGITSEGVPGSAVLKVADLRIMNVEMDILESEITKIHLEQPAMVFPDALPNRSYAATVSYISPQADRQKSIVEVKVRIESPDENLKPDMSARVYFLQERPNQPVVRRVVIPETAVFEEKNQKYVYTINENRLVRKPVVVGAIKEGKAYLISGLQGDESVVANQRSRYREGLHVVIKSAETAN